MFWPISMKIQMTQSKIAIIDISKNEFWKFPKSVIDDLRSLKIEVLHLVNPLTLKNDLEGVSTVICLPIDTLVLKRIKSLKNIIVLGSGVPASFRKLDEQVNIISAKGINASSVAAHALYLALRSLRGSDVLLSPGHLSLGIIGNGAVGREVARITKSIFKDVSVLARSGQFDFDITNLDEVFSFARMSDVIVFAIDCNEETKSIFRDDFFKTTKSRVKYINVARGELLDESLLVLDLTKNPEKKYFTDVTYPEVYPENGALKKMDNVYITKHVAGTYDGIWSDYLIFLQENLKQLELKGEL